MKTAIIILAILTVVFWFAYKILLAAVVSDAVETFKTINGLSAIGALSGICRIFSWLCAAATVILLMILLI